VFHGFSSLLLRGYFFTFGEVEVDFFGDSGVEEARAAAFLTPGR